MDIKKILIIAIIIGVLLIAAALWVILPVGNNESSGSEVCSCSADLNCDNFATQQEAQTCFEHCGPEDVHGLDRNNDGVVCETLP